MHYLSSYRVDLKLFQKSKYRFKFKNISISVTIRIFPRLEAYTAMIERQTTEIRLFWSFFFPTIQSRPFGISQIPEKAIQL